MSSPTRVSARVVVVDEDECVLLVRVVDPRDTKPPFWITPGGGTEGDETLGEAAARELREETGLVVSPNELGAPIAVARGDWEHRGTLLSSEDWYFGLRAPRFTPTLDGYTDLEREVHEVWRWWPPAELAAPRQPVLPEGLHGLVRTIVGGADGGGTPVVLPWTAL